MEKQIGDNINKYKDRAIVLVCSSDGYEDAWMPFFTLFSKYWGDCPYKIVLNTETKSYSYDGLDIICYTPYKNLSDKQIKKIPYGKRMIDTLSKMDCKYVILLMEDFFLKSKVNNARISEILGWMDEDPTIATFNMSYTFNDYNTISETYKGFRRAANYSDFKQNMMPGIWRKDVFETSWRKYESPWDWELFGTIRTFNNGLTYYLSDYHNKYNPVFAVRDPEVGAFGITSGKWTMDAVKIIQSNNINVDFNARGILDNESILNKYTNKNFFQKLLLCFDFKKVYSILRSCGFIWLLRYIRWKIYVFTHESNQNSNFVAWYRNKYKINK